MCPIQDVPFLGFSPLFPDNSRKGSGTKTAPKRSKIIQFDELEDVRFRWNMQKAQEVRGELA